LSGLATRSITSGQNQVNAPKAARLSTSQVTDLVRAVGATLRGDNQIKLKLPKKFSISFAIARHYRLQKAGAPAAYES
jgi:hypothetical protein